MVSIQHIPTNNPESKNPDFFCQENVFTRVFFKKIVYLNTNSEFVDIGNHPMTSKILDWKIYHCKFITIPCWNVGMVVDI